MRKGKKRLKKAEGPPRPGYDQVVSAIDGSVRQMELNGSLMNAIKVVCKRGVVEVEAAFEAVWENLRHRSGKRRLLALRVCAQLFQRSVRFRQLIAEHFRGFAEATLGFSADHPLLLPDLKTESVKLIDYWYVRYVRVDPDNDQKQKQQQQHPGTSPSDKVRNSGKSNAGSRSNPSDYKTLLRLGHVWLRDSVGIQFASQCVAPSSSSSSQHHEKQQQRRRRQKEERRQRLLLVRWEAMRAQLPEQEVALLERLRVMDELLLMLLPSYEEEEEDDDDGNEQGEATHTSASSKIHTETSSKLLQLQSALLVHVDGALTNQANYMDVLDEDDEDDIEWDDNNDATAAVVGLVTGQQQQQSGLTSATRSSSSSVPTVALAAVDVVFKQSALVEENHNTRPLLRQLRDSLLLLYKQFSPEFAEWSYVINHIEFSASDPNVEIQAAVRERLLQLQEKIESIVSKAARAGCSLQCVSSRPGVPIDVALEVLTSSH